MLGPYRQILALPGALAFSAAGLVARFPGSMVGISVVLMVSGLYGSYAMAGAVSATFVLALAAGGPQLARLVDRHGQARVMLPAMTVTAVSLVALVVCAALRAPAWALFVTAGIGGLTAGSIGALVRARWAHATRTPKELHTAYSLESALDEVSFVLGPIIATVLATSVTPWAGLLAAVVFMVTGGVAFLRLKGTEPPVSPPTTAGRRGSVMRSPAMVGLAVVFLLVGAIFGATDVAAVAFTAELGRPGSAGAVLAVFAGGSLIAGLLYGTRVWAGSMSRRFVVGVVLLAAGASLFLLAKTLLAMAAVMLLAGFAISPTLINGNSMAQHLVPRGRLTEGLTWLSTAVAIGAALGSATAGSAVDRAGSHGGFVVVALAGAASVVAALLAAPVLRDRATEAQLPTADEAVASTPTPTVRTSS